MTNRRDFLRYAAAATASAATSFSVNAKQIDTLPRRPIPGTDESLAVIGYGNARAFSEGNMPLSRELLEIFLNHGGSYIDTSGNGRSTVGAIARERDAHEQLFLGTYIEGGDYASMRAEIAQLREEQGVAAVDLVLSRSPIDFGNRRDQYQRLKDDGLARYVGVGRPNKRFYPDMIDLINDQALDVVQVNYSMMEPEAADEILPLAAEQKISAVINRPFINGRYFELVKGHELPQWAADFDCASWAQFSLKYILAHPAVNCVLTETSNPRHAVDNLGAGFGRLPDADEQRRMADLIRSFM